MTTKTPREVIVDVVALWFGMYEEDRKQFADEVLAALTAAGFAIHDTRTHVAVPREPTRVMWAAMGNAVVRTRERSGHHDHMSEAVYNAALAAAEEKPDAA